MIPTRTAAGLGLTWQSSVQEVTAALEDAGIAMRGGGGRPYPVDYHWRDVVLTDAITTLEDAELLLIQLDAEAKTCGWGSPTCTKARIIRQYLHGERGEFWRESPERIRSTFASNRRVCCGCHQTGSFHPNPPRQPWPEDLDEE